MRRSRTRRTRSGRSSGHQPRRLRLPRLAWVTETSVGQKGAPRRGAPSSILSLLWRIVGLIILDAMALAFAYSFFGGGLALAAALLLIITFLINIVFLVERLYP